MSKKKSPSKTKRTQKSRSIDHIPHCWRKPRTPISPKRRTDFSSLSLSQTHSANGLWFKSLNRVDKLTTTTASGKQRVNVELHIASCSTIQYTRRRLFSNAIPITGVEPVGLSALLEASNGRNLSQNGDSMSTSELVPDIPQVTLNNSLCVIRESAVLAKTSKHWLPAEALHKREHQSLSKQFYELSNDCYNPNKEYQTPDKWNSSGSSLTESPCEEMRRGKRERKPKVHFDEEPLPLTLARGVRRIRIMRSLGLAAPLGSPF